MKQFKDKILDWYSSLNERDRKILILFIAFLLPAISIYVYFKETAKHGEIEQKMAGLPSLEQLKLQSINMEKQIVYYKSQIPKLSAVLLNPNVKYAYATMPNQIPIILSSSISQAGGYVVLLEEGIPKSVIVNEYGKLVSVITNNQHKNNKKTNTIQKNKLFDVRVIPIKLAIAVSQDSINNLLSLFNKPNASYPFVFVNSIKFSFGKSQCSSNVFDTKGYYVINSQTYNAQYLNTTKPIIICLSGYAIADIKPKKFIKHNHTPHRGKISNHDKLVRSTKNVKTK